MCSTMKRMVIAEVEEVSLKYKSQEERIDYILRKKEPGESGLLVSTVDDVQAPKLSLQEAKDRNRQMLKELEFVKGNLRSKSIFSPTELQWEKVCQQYQENPSLPVTIWHCHQPVFV